MRPLPSDYGGYYVRIANGELVGYAPGTSQTRAEFQATPYREKTNLLTDSILLISRKRKQPCFEATAATALPPRSG